MTCYLIIHMGGIQKWKT